MFITIHHPATDEQISLLTDELNVDDMCDGIVQSWTSEDILCVIEEIHDGYTLQDIADRVTEVADDFFGGPVDISVEE